MYNYFYEENMDCRECLTKGPYLLDPTMRAIREVLIYEVKQLSYYLIKTKDLGFENIALIDRMLEIISSINFSLEYNKESIEDMLNEMRSARTGVIEFYTQLCLEKSFDCQLIKSAPQEFDIKIDLISAIRQGEKHVVAKNTQLPKYKKDLLETITIVSKSAASILVQLNDLAIPCNEEKYEVLELISCLNFTHYDEEKLVKKIMKFSETNYHLHEELFENNIKRYGEPNLEVVKHDFHPGKCILVSGNNLHDLELLLLATQDKDINVYTHDKMILAFAYPYFQKFPHLKGHFQSDLSCFQTDFAKFPGPVLLTRDYSEKADNIFRGRVYSVDSFTGKGFSKISQKNFEPIIECAQQMEGFRSYVKKITTKVGYDPEEIKEKVKEIAFNLKNKKYEKVFIIGLVNYCLYKEEFINELFRKIGEKNFIISLIGKGKASNIYNINSMLDFPMLYRIIEEFKKYDLGDNLPITVFITQCNRYTVSNVLNFQHLGVKNIYLCCCLAHGINPSVMDCLANDFNVKKIPLNLEFDT